MDILYIVHHLIFVFSFAFFLRFFQIDDNKRNMLSIFLGIIISTIIYHYITEPFLIEPLLRPTI